MSLRSILIIVGVLIVAVILIDGLRHWRRARQHEKEMEKRSSRRDDDFEPTFEKKLEFNDDFDFEPKLNSEEIRAEVRKVEELLSTPKPEPKLEPRPEPRFEPNPEPKPMIRSATASQKPTPVKMPAPLPKKEKFIILHILSEPDTYFSGEALAAKFAELDLHYGPMDIFHSYEPESDDILFSVANAFEPGTLNLDYPKGFYTQGLTFFIQLPGGDTQQSFEAMLNTATVLAKSFNARLCDHQRQPLTPARVEEYRFEVSACNVI
ncbi:MAG: cell division protein ZipA [Legionellales bacterium]|jgi:cell division protein ZipA